MTLVTEEQAESLKAYSKALEILSLAFWNTLRETRDKDRAVAAQRATAEKHNCLNVLKVSMLREGLTMFLLTEI